MRLILVSIVILLITSHTGARFSTVTKEIDIDEERKLNSKVSDIFTILQANPGSENQRYKFKILDTHLRCGVSRDSLHDELLRHSVFEMTTSGDVIQVKRIDREENCGKNPICFFSLKIFVKPKLSNTQLFILNINIKDTNDNRPLFKEDILDVVVSETAKVGHLTNINQAKATDSDLGENSRLTYQMEPNNFFQLVQPDTKVEKNNQNISLKLLKPLDYTKVSTHELMLHVSDNGLKKLRNSLKIRVKLTNENNHTPKFEHEVYNVTIGENWKPERLLIQVKATDEDEVKDKVTSIRYSLTGTLVNNDDVTKTSLRFLTTRGLDDVLPLKIRQNDGWLVLNRKVDYKNDNGMKLLIVADDSDVNNPRKGTAIIKITVKDDNNHDPNINLNCLKSCVNNTIYIEENSGKGKAVAHVSAIDQDENLNGKIKLRVGTLLQPDDTSTFIDLKSMIITDDGLLKTERSFDHETENEIDMFIQACDHGSPPRCTLENFKLVILDKNDNSPYFTQCKNFNLSESTKIGEIVSKVLAKDADFIMDEISYSYGKNYKIIESPNGIITYSIEQIEPVRSRFIKHLEIDAKTGVINLKNKFDFESENKFTFRVTATDGGNLKSNCDVTVNIKDENDNPPHFVSPPQNYSDIYMTTTLPKNTVFFTFQTYDRDGNSKVSFTFKVKQKDSEIYIPYEFDDRFEINTLTGEFKLNENHQVPIGKSLLGKYEIEVEAWDGIFSTKIISFVNIISSPLPTQLGSYISPPEGATETDETPDQGGFASLHMMIVIAVCASGLIVAVSVAICLFYYGPRKNSSDDKSDRNETEVVALTSITPSSDNTSKQLESEEYKSEISSTNVNNQIDYLKPLLSYPRCQSSMGVVYNVPRHQLTSCDGKSLPRHQLKHQISTSTTPAAFNLNDTISEASTDIVPNSLPPYNSRCNKNCFKFGHSDNCWMPTQNNNDAGLRYLQTCHHKKQPSEISSVSSTGSKPATRRPYTSMLHSNNPLHGNHVRNHGYVSPFTAKPLQLQEFPLNENQEDRKDSGCGSNCSEIPSQFDDHAIVASQKLMTSQQGSCGSSAASSFVSKNDVTKKTLPSYDDMITSQTRRKFDFGCAL